MEQIRQVMAQEAALEQQHGMLVPGAVVTRSHSSRADMIAKFFNTDAFIATNKVPRGMYGDSGRNIISGPGFSITDFSAIKDFPIKEPYRIQFRSEFFNVFNQVRLGCTDTTWGCSDPSATVNSSSFGQIRSAGAAREIQFALKFIW